MNFAVEAGALASAIGRVKGCAPSKSTIPILQHVLVRAAEGHVSVRATNLDMEADARERADVAVEGAVALPGDILHGICKRLGKTDLVTIRVDEARVEVVCGRSRYSLRYLPPDEFPSWGELDEGDGVARFEIEGKHLRTILDGVLYAVAPSDTRAFFQGVYLHEHDGQIVAVGSDGNRFAERAIGAPDGMPDFPGVIIPYGAARQMLELISDDAVPARLTVTAQRIEIAAGGARFASRLIDAQFPPYREIIPPFEAATFATRPKALSTALDRALLVYAASDEKAPAIDLVTGSSGIDLSAGLQDRDGAVESVEADVSERGAKARLAAKYVAEMLRAVPDCALEAQVAPAIVVFASKDVPGMRHAIATRTR